MPRSDATDNFDEPLPSSLWEALHVPPPRQSDDRFAPEVDLDFLGRLVRKELSPELVRAAYHLIHAFESWKKAYAEVVIENFTKHQARDDDRSS